VVRKIRLSFRRCQIDVCGVGIIQSVAEIMDFESLSENVALARQEGSEVPPQAGTDQTILHHSSEEVLHQAHLFAEPLMILSPLERYASAINRRQFTL
jgi:hypothetical protein